MKNIICRLLCLSVLAVVLVGCGGGGGSATPTPVPTATPTPTPTSTPIPVPTVTLTGNKANPLRGEPISLTWTSANATALKRANFTATGLNSTAVVTPTANTTYFITVEGPGGEQTATFTVTVADVTVTVSPSSTAIPINKISLLSATVTGAIDNTVTWSVKEADGGTIVPNATNPLHATYTAPATPGTYHVIATSNADPTKTATVEVRAQTTSGTVILN